MLVVLGSEKEKTNSSSGKHELDVTFNLTHFEPPSPGPLFGKCSLAGDAAAAGVLCSSHTLTKRAEHRYKVKGVPLPSACCGDSLLTPCQMERKREKEKEGQSFFHLQTHSQLTYKR